MWHYRLRGNNGIVFPLNKKTRKRNAFYLEVILLNNICLKLHGGLIFARFLSFLSFMDSFQQAKIDFMLAAKSLLLLIHWHLVMNIMSPVCLSLASKYVSFWQRNVRLCLAIKHFTFQISKTTCKLYILSPRSCSAEMFWRDLHPVDPSPPPNKSAPINKPAYKSYCCPSRSLKLSYKSCKWINLRIYSPNVMGLLYPFGQ